MTFLSLGRCAWTTVKPKVAWAYGERRNSASATMLQSPLPIPLRQATVPFTPTACDCNCVPKGLEVVWDISHYSGAQCESSIEWPLDLATRCTAPRRRRNQMFQHEVRAAKLAPRAMPPRSLSSHGSHGSAVLASSSWMNPGQGHDDSRCEQSYVYSASEFISNKDGRKGGACLCLTLGRKRSGERAISARCSSISTPAIRRPSCKANDGPRAGRPRRRFGSI